MTTRPISLSRHLPRRAQQGAVLYVALVFLLIMALLGVAGMQVSMLQERMSANYRATNIAFQRAEAVASLNETAIEAALKAYADTGAEDCRRNPGFDPVIWAQGQATAATPEESENLRDIAECMPGGSLGERFNRPKSERTNQRYQVTAFAPDLDAGATSDAAVDTIFIP